MTNTKVMMQSTLYISFYTEKHGITITRKQFELVILHSVNKEDRTIRIIPDIYAVETFYIYHSALTFASLYVC